MSGSRERKRQLKIEKARQKRERVRKQARQQALATTGKALIRRASAAPFGPCWISESLETGDDTALVSVVVTRRVTRNLVAQFMCVDRTCLGVKIAALSPLISELEVEARTRDFADDGDSLRRCEPLLAQSVVFHALDYAHALGFSPDPDFEETLIGSRPDTLLDTPGARRERPFYLPGPEDPVGRVLLQLEAKLGRDGFDFVLPAGIDLDGDFAEDDLEEEDEDDGVDGAVLAAQRRA